MTAQEILKSKVVLSVKDISTIFEISEQVAYKKIREIRNVSDRLGFSGKCHIDDYYDYVNRFNKKRMSPVQDDIQK